MKIAGKTAIVTGGASGLGEAAVERLQADYGSVSVHPTCPRQASARNDDTKTATSSAALAALRSPRGREQAWRADAPRGSQLEAPLHRLAPCQ